MKKFIAVVTMVIILTMSMGIAQAEMRDVTEVIKTNVVDPELTELQEKADQKFADSRVWDVALYENNSVSVGEAKYQTETNSGKRSWVQKAWDFVTFWD
jgi:hypothetical protein